MPTPALHLIPVPLTDLSAADPAQSLPADVLSLIRSLRHFVVENAKSARAFLKTVDMPVAIANLTINELPGHGKLGKSTASASQLDALLTPLAAGTALGLLSEAGCPAVADPGAELVNRAHQRGLRIVPHIGPSSLLLALMASGLGGQCFAFQGYLPQDEAARQKSIQTLEKLAKNHDQTQIIIETPYRNHSLYDALLKYLQPTTRLCIAVDLTSSAENIQTQTVRDWQNSPPPDLNKRPAVFLFKP